MTNEINGRGLFLGTTIVNHEKLQDFLDTNNPLLIFN